ncbi:FkbM family methyltransferase [Dyadobacter psychrotolerans]|uniref:FkbM family methyltransferase n=1 Tax=Dyadobacter psychrotolerans TaxID=2541721 RepID=A0A4R5E0Y3_9BACT|nr:FkbM family methyltransferase [Dyadobacter psychrotolerans]TDE18620.1 FkbM family methyltransferase [Dyadobacter psychrotolerans]
MKLKTIKTILNHPLNKNRQLSALLTFLKRGLVIRLHKHPIVYPFIENTFLVVDKGMSSAELQIYTSLYDTNEMLFMMHFLRPEDTFVDVGANIGVYSVLASGVSGAKSIAFEPIPSTFSRLKRNINYNNLTDKAILFNMGVGDKEETLVFSNSLDAINHVITDKNFSGSITNVPVNSLDNLMVNEMPNLLKIDVEGFEANVINGAAETLKRPELKVIIMETNGLSDQYEFGQNYIHNKLLSLGFTPNSYDPAKRTIIPIESTNPENTIYIRDMEFVNERVKKGQKIRLINKLL